MKTREDILRLEPYNPWIGWMLGISYLISSCVALVLIPLATALIWIALTSPLLMIADELCAATEISKIEIRRRSPLGPRIAIPWKNVKRAILVQNRKNNRACYIRSRRPPLGSICLTSKQRNFREGLRRIFEIAHRYDIDIEIKGLSPIHEWEQWLRQ